MLVYVVCTTVASSQRQAEPRDAPSSNSRDEYIVVLNEDLSDAQVEHHKWQVHTNTSAAVVHDFHIGKGFRGYSVIMDSKLCHVISEMNHVKHIEKNQIVQIFHANCTVQRDSTWGAIRTTMRDRPSSYFNYIYKSDSAGDGVDVYIIDSGIDISHPEFGGRAKWGTDFVDNPSPITDLNGHGTHVAGIVMSNTWGLAKKATAIAVRVLDGNGFGTTAGIIAGIEWVANRVLNESGRSVANLSLGGSRSFALDDAVNAAVDLGMHIAVAAGNSWQNACDFSPAAASKSITVAASDRFDEFAWFSNWGYCVDIVAPGVLVTSTWINGGVRTLSGTSMAAPHVCGVMAKILSEEETSTITTDDMKKLLKNTATRNKLFAIPDTSTPNALVFKNCSLSEM